MSELAPAIWTARAEAHRARAEEFLGPQLARMRRGERHPVWDFLFTYYSLRPGRLLRWHPGYGVTLTGPAALAYAALTGYRRVPGGVRVSEDHLAARAGTVGFVRQLLTATAARPARYGCFGMHEWAMVYRSPRPRHARLPLRLGAAGTDAVLESMPLRCTHYDAYRFFTGAATGRNEIALTRPAQLEHEQPGCLHANMDLYKWAGKLSPLVDSELLLDCLLLAADARLLDMAASPYDLAELGVEPVRVEDAAGRVEYVRRQGEIAERAAGLRARLAAQCQALADAHQPA